MRCGGMVLPMPDSDALLLFGTAATVLLLVPGPAVLYIVAQSAEHGRTAGLASVAGLHLGTFVHTAAAAIGVSALVVSSAVAFSTVKYAGAAYLIFLGVRRLLAGDPELPSSPPAAAHRGIFLQGIVVGALNPKTALFFLAFMPQFVDRDSTVWTQVVVFGAMFAAIGLVTDSLYAVGAGWLGQGLRRHRRALRLSSASVYIGLGAATALTRRTA
jgi:threonine/homoserine/homoserine lactone efflux protein